VARADPISGYARRIVSGKIPACSFIKLACERHLSDLAKYRASSKRSKYYFDKDLARKAIDFYPLLKHSKGEWAGQPFELSDFQQFCEGSLEGWRRRKDGLRRFRNAYIEIPRKNGKTTWAAGRAIKHAFGDKEPGAEVYVAATKRDQAKLAWEEAKRMVQSTPTLKKRVTVLRGVSNLNIAEKSQKLEPLGADADTLDGLNIHAAVIDEVHAHKNRAMVDVLETATGARRQPMLFYITTAGYDRNSVCWELHDYSIKVLQGVVDDDTWFAYIATIDEGDDWKDPKVWAKANPNLGVSVKVDDLRLKCDKAKELPAAQNAFRQKHLDEWTEQSVRWFSLHLWDSCEDPREERELDGESCFAGLDLAITRDISALVLAFPDDGAFDTVARFWIPEENMRDRVRRDRVPYDVWVDQGWMVTTPGDVTDYAFIRQEINKLAKQYQVQALAYDPWNATQLAIQLQDDGANMIEFRQGYVSMNEPCKQLERLITSGKIRHGGNPVLRWMASNVTVKPDPQQNIKIDKADSQRNRVDGIVALTMAIGCWLRQEEIEGSVYETQDLWVI
jgi:phage terminase large subunit-like protein